MPGSFLIAEVTAVFACLLATTLAAAESPASTASPDILPPCSTPVDNILGSDDYTLCRAHVYVLSDADISAPHAFVLTPRNARVVYRVDACLSSLRALLKVAPPTACLVNLTANSHDGNELIVIDKAQLDQIISPRLRDQRRRLLTDENGYLSGKLKCKYDGIPLAGFNDSDPTQEFVLDCQEIEGEHKSSSWSYIGLCISIGMMVVTIVLVALCSHYSNRF